MSRSMRNRRRVSYFETEEPSFDSYVFCSECGEHVYEYCSIHGPLLIIPDEQVPSPTGLPPLVPRAALTIPRSFLHLAPSTIPDAGIGVFSTRTLPKGVRFGPYRGLKTGKVTSSYCWQIFDHNRKPIHTLDARDPNRSNWMRYVNCSRHYSEQNLLAFQYKGKLYYRTIKIIPRFTELLVFYGSEFANELNVDLRRYHSSTFEKPLAKLEPKDEQDRRAEIKIVKCFPTVKPGSGPEDVRDTQIPEMKLINVEPDDEQGTQIPVKNPEKYFSRVIYEMEDVEQNTPIPMQYVKGFSFINESDDEREPTSQEMQLDTDGVVDAKDYILQNIDSVNLVQNIHYESELFTEAKIWKQPKDDNSESNDLEIGCKVNCGQSDQKGFKDTVMHNVATSFNKLKKYSCPICEAAFVTKSEFINHDIKVHDSKNNYKACTICDYKTVRNGHLNAHMKTHCDKKYKCDICGYETQYLLYLERHKKKHVCKYCQRIFKTGGQLYRHLILHREDKTYDEDEHITHFKTHTESTHTCTDCGKEFEKAYSLKMHMATHSQLRPYICGICKNGYKHRHSFRRHMKLHVNENQ